MSVEAIGLVKASFNDRNSTGSISVPGLKVGDKLIGAWLVSNSQWDAPGHQFEAIVSVDDELQQIDNITAGNVTWNVVLVR